MELIVSAGLIGLIVLWGLVSPATLGSAVDQALAVITRNFGWLYLWIVPSRSASARCGAGCVRCCSRRAASREAPAAGYAIPARAGPAAGLKIER